MKRKSLVFSGGVAKVGTPLFQSWRQGLGGQPSLEPDLESVGLEGHENVSFHPLLRLVINRTQPRLTLPVFEGSFHPGQLDIAFPEHFRVLAHEVRAQKRVSVTKLRLLQFRLVQLQGERLAGDGLPLLRQAQSLIGIAYPGVCASPRPIQAGRRLGKCKSWGAVQEGSMS